MLFLVAMPRLIAIKVYEVDEVCSELANRTGKREKYSHTRVIQLIHQYLPTVEKAGRRYFLTDAEIDWLATQIDIERRRKTIDN